MTQSIDPSLRTDDFDYSLPAELIAQTPLPNRHDSRLMVLNRATGGTSHTRFSEIGGFLHAGDVVVANNTRVFGARLAIKREPSGGTGEVRLLRQHEDGSWEALARPARRLRDGEAVTVLPAQTELDPVEGGIVIQQHIGDGIVRVQLSDVVAANLDNIGRTPLPPYITHHLDDPARYQTTYATASGSAAAPTAGLHFSEELIESLK
ncbi:MAG: S-adenosylmethionine:tRNA ribosyltransferase-isomerase, partial [Thermomicrobiales bacterium]